MYVLVACEYSGVVRDAFIAEGHKAMSCDILPTESKGPHFTGDVQKIICEPWDLVIAHPPCTYLANSGVRFLHEPNQAVGYLKGQPRWEALKRAADFFNIFLRCKAPRVCIENPIMHGYARDLLDTHYQQIIQPWQFGHKETKATCLWLKGLPLLEETDNVQKEMLKLGKNEINRLANISPGPNRGKIRSKTFTGIAEAMAKQWGSL